MLGHRHRLEDVAGEVLRPVWASLANVIDFAEFVFRRDPDSPDDAPQDTTLQRAITTHLRSGRHWQL